MATKLIIARLLFEAITTVVPIQRLANFFTLQVKV